MLQLLNPNILSKYVFYQLRESANPYGFNRSYRVSLTNMESVSINVPVDKNGKYDVELQRDLIGKYICKVEYKGTSVNRGVAKIVRPIDGVSIIKEMTNNFNKVEMSGMSFAPPGSGMF